MEKEVIYVTEVKFKFQKEVTYVTQHTYDNENNQVHGKDLLFPTKRFEEIRIMTTCNSRVEVLFTL